jgi:hypothetical protein
MKISQHTYIVGLARRNFFGKWLQEKMVSSYFVAGRGPRFVEGAPTEGPIM